MAPFFYHPSLGWSFGNLAARTGDFEIFCCLLEAGADINFRGGRGNSMLHEAVCSRTSSLDIVNKVLRDSTCQQSDIDESLRYAPEFGQLEIVERLLHAGADPNYADEHGATALAHAVVFDQPAIAMRLLVAGADPTVRIPYEEHYKKTIVEVAASKNMQEFLDACDPQSPPAALPALNTLHECLKSIDVWLSTHFPQLRFAVPHSNPSQPPPLNESSFQDDVLLLFRTLDGSNGECVVPMPSDSDISYELVTFDAALNERQMMLELNAQERVMPGAQRDFWRPTWLPFASNGAGDSLFWDSITGQVLQFSHENRLVHPRADSLFALFQDIAYGLETGKYTYTVQRGIA